MKKLLVGILIVLFNFIISSCNNQNKSSENQSVNSPEVQPADSSANLTQTAQSDLAKQQDETQATGDKGEFEITGNQIIENILNKLNDKLNLSEQQFKDLNDVLTKTFVETGGDLSGKYTIEISKKMGRELRQKSYNSIIAILNAEQKEHFEKFMQK